MARIHVMVLGLGLTGLWPLQARAQSSSAEADVMANIPDVPDGRRSYAQSAYGKLRPGFNLGGPEAIPPAADTQGELGHRRDILVRQHYSHMAELDAIAEAAIRNKDVATAERTEALRRRDTQSFMLAMQGLRRLLLVQQAEVGP